MAFINMGDTSVLVILPMEKYLMSAQRVDVVAGIRNPLPISLRETKLLEKHLRRYAGL